ILRFDVDKGDPYDIPIENPFYSDFEHRQEIYSYGLRNPWRFSFDSKTGEWRIVIDGKIESKLKLAKNEIAAEEAKQLWIGRDQCCGDRFGTITVDEAMVFDVALGEEELTEIYTNGIDGALAVNNRGKLTVSWGKVKVQ
ncbi:PQQ-dependent sugar dehydrogenase, partial [Candidatus Poribacteria bacterium]|nr:PQQ-dependent sugar dehydrogenase [Candidatus Poribacteria bacterium]